MKLYIIDDGYNWWVTGESADEALRLAWKMDIDEEKILTADDLVVMDPDEEFRIFLPDFHPSDLDADEYPNKPEKDDKDRWFCTATVGEWIEGKRAGDVIASDVF